MSGTGRALGAAARLLALLAVVLGLLAMHGLASTHHAAASPVKLQPATAGVGVPLQPQERAGSHQHESVVSGARTAALSGKALALPVPACGDECPSDVAVLCAAVVAVAAATAWRLAAAAARQRVPACPAHGASQPRAPAAARRRSTGPDLVSELCVSRT